MTSGRIPHIDGVGICIRHRIPCDRRLTVPDNRNNMGHPGDNGLHREPENALRRLRGSQNPHSRNREHCQRRYDFLGCRFKCCDTHIERDRQAHRVTSHGLCDGNSIVRIPVIIQRRQEPAYVGHFRIGLICRALDQINRRDDVLSCNRTENYRSDGECDGLTPHVFELPF